MLLFHEPHFWRLVRVAYRKRDWLLGDDVSVDAYVRHTRELLTADPIREIS